jgi:hypothetical protein
MDGLCRLATHSLPLMALPLDERKGYALPGRVCNRPSYAYVSKAEPHKERSELSESLRLSAHQAAKPLNDLDCEGSLRYIN